MALTNIDSVDSTRVQQARPAEQAIERVARSRLHVYGRTQGIMLLSRNNGVRVVWIDPFHI